MRIAQIFSHTVYVRRPSVICDIAPILLNFLKIQYEENFFSFLLVNCKAIQKSMYDIKKTASFCLFCILYCMLYLRKCTFLW